MKNIILTLFLLSTLSSLAQTSPENGLFIINRKSAETYIGILAGDSLQGRGAGKVGGRMAAEYIKSVFEEIGIKAWRGSYYHSFRRHIGNNPNYEMQNVLGYIEGKNTWEIVMIGAHYDHLGIKANDTNDSIYNGADDNASGVSAVLQIAKAFIASGQKPERTIIFALWDGEEMGLLGSSHFVEEHSSYIPIPMVSPVPVKGYIDCDMIGRNKDGDGSHVDIYFTESKPNFAEWIISDIEKYKLALNPLFSSLESSPGGSDHVPFLEKGVPVIFYNTGLHSDYHQPSDETKSINYDKVVDITKLAYLNLWNMANLISF